MYSGTLSQSRDLIVQSMSFYPDFIKILSAQNLDKVFFTTLFRLYSDILETRIIQIIYRFYPSFILFYLDKIWIKSG